MTTFVAQSSSEEQKPVKQSSRIDIPEKIDWQKELEKIEQELALPAVSEDGDDVDARLEKKKSAEATVPLFPSTVQAYQASQAEIDEVIRDLELMEESNAQAATNAEEKKHVKGKRAPPKKKSKNTKAKNTKRGK